MKGNFYLKIFPCFYLNIIYLTAILHNGINMKKTLLLLLSLVSLTVYSQKNGEEIKLLEQISKKINSYKCIFIVFHIENMTGKSENIEANIKIKGEKYRLEIMDAINYFDGKALYNYIPEIREVYVKEPDKNDIYFNPARILASYRSLFSTKIVEEDARKCIVEMLPSDKESSIRKIRMIIDKIRLLPTGLKISQWNKEDFHIEIKTLKEIPEIDDSDFTFDISAYPETEYIDLRE